MAITGHRKMLKENIDILQTDSEEIQSKLCQVEDALKFSLQEQDSLSEELNDKEK